MIKPGIREKSKAVGTKAESEKLQYELSKKKIQLIIILAVVCFSGKAYSADFDATGTWTYYVSNAWAVGCVADRTGSGTAVIIQTGNTFTINATDTAGPITASGTISGAVYTFNYSYFEDGGTTTVYVTFTMTSPTTVTGSSTWTWPDPYGYYCYGGDEFVVPLTVTKTGSGSGTVTDSAGKLSWSGNTATGYYDFYNKENGGAGLAPNSAAASTTVTLTAVPDSGSILESWSGGGCSGSGTTCAVSMQGATSVTASFAVVGTISGFVKDSSGSPIYQATIATDNGGYGQSEANGAYIFSILPATNIKVTASKSGYSSQSQFIDNGGENSVVNFTIYALSVASLPFNDGFENGTLGSDWTTNSSGAGRIQVTMQNSPYAGNYHLTTDSSTDGTYSLNELVLTIDLAGRSDVQLSFYQKEFDDESDTMPSSFTGSNNSDGVAVSIDGTNWYKVVGLESAINNTYKPFIVDLDPVFSANGLSYTNSVKIKFQQYDNWSILSDGFAFDNIQVTAAPLIPTLSEWGMIIFIILLLLSGMLRCKPESYKYNRWKN